MEAILLMGVTWGILKEVSLRLRFLGCKVRCWGLSFGCGVWPGLGLEFSGFGFRHHLKVFNISFSRPGACG